MKKNKEDRTRREVEEEERMSLRRSERTVSHCWLSGSSAVTAEVDVAERSPACDLHPPTASCGDSVV